MNSIFARSSVRHYLDQPIEKEKVDLILRAGFAAPSAMNAQPWEFIVIDDPKVNQQLSELSPYAKMLAKAPLGIVVCANLERSHMIDFCEQDCAAATQNMLVEAKTLEIGSVWLGMYPLEDRVNALREYFQLPEHIVPLWMIAFGYPDEKENIKDKFHEEFIHYQKW